MEEYIYKELLEKISFLNENHINENIVLKLKKILEENKFYILTHKGIAPLVVKRAKDAVEGKAPNLVDLMKYPDKTHTDTSLD